MLVCLFSSWQYFLNALQRTVDTFPALPSGAQLSEGWGLVRGEGKEGTDSCLALFCVVYGVQQPRGSLSSDHLLLQHRRQRPEEDLAARCVLTFSTWQPNEEHWIIHQLNGIYRQWAKPSSQSTVYRLKLLINL